MGMHGVASIHVLLRHLNIEVITCPFPPLTGLSLQVLALNYVHVQCGLRAQGARSVCCQGMQHTRASNTLANVASELVASSLDPGKDSMPWRALCSAFDAAEAQMLPTCRARPRLPLRVLHALDWALSTVCLTHGLWSASMLLAITNTW